MSLSTVKRRRDAGGLYKAARWAGESSGVTSADLDCIWQLQVSRDKAFRVNWYAACCGRHRFFLQGRRWPRTLEDTSAACSRKSENKGFGLGARCWHFKLANRRVRQKNPFGDMMILWWICRKFGSLPSTQGWIFIGTTHYLQW